MLQLSANSDEVSLSQMNSIPSHLLDSLHNILLRCGPFATDNALSTAFIDERIALWQSQIPQANNPSERVNLLINFLSKQYDNRGDNGLALFLQVVRDRTNRGDGCWGQLDHLVNGLQQENGRSTATPTPRTNIPKLNRFQLYSLLDKKFNLKELDKLAFFLEISLEDIPGGTREGKIRELIQYAERHSRFDELIQKIIELRPDALK